MKLDPKRGAEDLETFGFACTSLGALFYCLIGGRLMEPSLENPNTLRPMMFFYMTALNAFFIILVGVLYPKSSEKNLTDDEKANPQDDKTLLQKFQLMWKVLKVWRVKRVFLYIFVVTLTCTNQDVFLIYSNEV